MRYICVYKHYVSEWSKRQHLTFLVRKLLQGYIAWQAFNDMKNFCKILPQR
jgi:hypothetical protein